MGSTKYLVTAIFFLVSALTAGATERNESKPQINLMIMGETGAGKSSVINLLYNLVANDIDGLRRGEIHFPIGTRDDDREQFQQNVPEFEAQNAEAEVPGNESQTQSWGQYTVENQDYLLTIYDTPGFNDTGANQDPHALAVDNIIECFEDSDTKVHALAFVVPSGFARGTETFRTIVNRLNGIIHENFRRNIIFLITKCDARRVRIGSTIEALNPLFDGIANEDTCFKFSAVPLFEQGEEDSLETWNRSSDELRRMLGYCANLEPVESEQIIRIKQLKRDGNHKIEQLMEACRSIHGNECSLTQLKKDLSYTSTLVEDNKDYIDEVTEEEDVLYRVFKYVVTCQGNLCKELNEYRGRADDGNDVERAIRNAENNRASYCSNLNEREREHDNLRSQNRGLDDEISQLHTDKTNKTAEKNNKVTERDVKTAMCQELESDLTQLREALSNKNNERVSLTNNIRGLRGRKDDISASKSRIETEISEINAQINNLNIVSLEQHKTQAETTAGEKSITAGSKAVELNMAVEAHDNVRIKLEEQTTEKDRLESLLNQRPSNRLLANVIVVDHENVKVLARADVEKELTRVREKIAEIEGKLEQKAERLAQVRISKFEADQAFEIAERNRESSIAALNTAQDKRADLQANLNGKNQALAGETNKLRQVEHDLLVSSENRGEVDHEIESLNNSIREKETSQQNHEEQISNLRREISSLEQNITQIEGNISRKRQTNSQNSMRLVNLTTNNICDTCRAPLWSHPQPTLLENEETIRRSRSARSENTTRKEIYDNAKRRLAELAAEIEELEETVNDFNSVRRKLSQEILEVKKNLEPIIHGGGWLDSALTIAIKKIREGSWTGAEKDFVVDILTRLVENENEN